MKIELDLSDIIVASIRGLDKAGDPALTYDEQSDVVRDYHRATTAIMGQLRVLLKEQQ
jgi:hypothetical protein